MPIVLIASGQVRADCVEKTLALGELSLDGSVRHVRGVLLSIFPPLSLEENLDVTRICSVADQLPSDTPLIR